MYDERTAVTSQPLSRDAFSALVERFQQPLYAFLRGFVENGEQARDLTQDTFASAWRATQAVFRPFHRGDTRR